MEVGKKWRGGGDHTSFMEGPTCQWPRGLWMNPYTGSWARMQDLEVPLYTHLLQLVHVDCIAAVSNFDFNPALAGRL